MLIVCGCAPAPKPTPTATALFSNEAEAFAAAEKTYRSYVAESNAERDGDRTADPNRWLSGDALEAAIDSRKNSESEGVHIEGHTQLTSIAPVSVNFAKLPVVAEIDVCIDVSATRVVGDDGVDYTPEQSRPPVVARVTLTLSAEGRTVADTDVLEGRQC